ncbi:hypothetical protein LAC81_15145 [Ensifer adhaerens]|uniref:hypothetical protein n=1 Tax=Ensifer adhaerens TaxID=106592 RepID=UPI001CBF141F|nr:hypothetical protein [Ensifer adhaerens]MBZ7923126.1 hypothetical protein [Ensifer adhaerens]UAX91716.1 hypothetical protein LAC78_15140 [Ensifer adhaerens]UAX99344.1 hypothetical protein LAC80_15145 [Ensifer adhaerens]UAY06727.1 hypothetical protein LAC81_15145 [Ensifer adhaerens]
MAVSPDRAREKTQLARFRDIADRLMGDDWEIDVDGSATRIIAKRSTGEAVALCTIHADALASELELLSSGLVLLRLFLSLQDRAAATVLDLRGQLEGRARANRPASQVAAILCGKPTFHRFLEGRGAGGAVRSADEADTRLKFLLNIQSKKQLDDDASCAARFRKLRGDYDLYMRARPA